MSAIKHQIIAESLRSVARIRPEVAMVMAETLEADEHELERFAASLTARRSRIRAQPGGRSDPRDRRTSMTKRTGLFTPYEKPPEPKELKLTERQFRYFLGRLAGKSKFQAALAAGYSRHSGLNAAYNIERRGKGGDPSIRRVLGLLERGHARELVEFLDRQQARNGAEAKSATEVQPDQ